MKVIISCLAVALAASLIIYSCCIVSGNKPDYIQRLEDDEQYEYLIKKSQDELGKRRKRH